MHLSDNEYTIMKVFWNERKPLIRGEILKGTQGRNWNPSSIHQMLNSLVSKGLIRVTEDSNKYGRTYEAVISQGEWIRAVLKEMLKGDSEEETLFIVLDAFIKKNGRVSKKMMKTVLEHLESMNP